MQFRYVRLAIAFLVGGTAATVAVAWGCAMWSPIRTTIDPFPKPAGIDDTLDPDGVVGLHYHQSGPGWMYLSLRGECFVTNGRENVFWTGPYGGVFHRVAGWPLPALRSRVEVLDSQVSSRFSEGEPEPEVVTQRRKWELPAHEIVYRGIATKALPAWLHAEPDRRLPLVPIALGFAVNSLTYALAFAFVAGVSRAACRRFRSAPHGFPVITKVAAKSGPTAGAVGYNLAPLRG